MTNDEIMIASVGAALKGIKSLEFVRRRDIENCFGCSMITLEGDEHECTFHWGPATSALDIGRAFINGLIISANVWLEIGTQEREIDNDQNV